VLTIRRPMKVYAILTESLRQGMNQELDAQMQQLDQTLDELAWQRKRAESQAGDTQSALLQHIEQERRRESERRTRLQEQKRDIAALPLGVEMLHSTVDAEVCISVGDVWEAKVNPEVVLQDGRVIAIRGIEE